MTFDELEATDAPDTDTDTDTNTNTNTNTNTAEGEAIAVQVLDKEEELDVDTMLASIEEQGPAEETDALTETSDDEAVPYEVLDDDDDLDIDEVLASIEELGAKQHLEVPETVESIDVTVLPASDDVPAESVDDDEAEGAELSKPEERDRLIAQALAHAETQDARYRQRIGTDQTGRWKGLLAVIVFVIAGYVGAAPPAWVQGEGAPAITESDQLRGLRVSLLLQAREVETFRALNQRLPESLDELSGRLPGISFVPSGQRTYQLFGITPAGRRVVYDPVGLDADFESLESELAKIASATIRSAISPRITYASPPWARRACRSW